MVVLELVTVRLDREKPIAELCRRRRHVVVQRVVSRAAEAVASISSGNVPPSRRGPHARCRPARDLRPAAAVTQASAALWSLLARPPPVPTARSEPACRSDSAPGGLRRRKSHSKHRRRPYQACAAVPGHRRRTCGARRGCAVLRQGSARDSESQCRMRYPRPRRELAQGHPGWRPDAKPGRLCHPQVAAGLQTRLCPPAKRRPDTEPLILVCPGLAPAAST